MKRRTTNLQREGWELVNNTVIQCVGVPGLKGSTVICSKPSCWARLREVDGRWKVEGCVLLPVLQERPQECACASASLGFDVAVWPPGCQPMELCHCYSLPVALCHLQLFASECREDSARPGKRAVVKGVTVCAFTNSGSFVLCSVLLMKGVVCRFGRRMHR